VRGFYWGLSSPLIGGAAETGVNYLIYSRILDFFKQQEQLHSRLQHVQQLDGSVLLQPHLAHSHHLHTLQQQQQQVMLPYHHQQQQQQQYQELPPPLRAVPVAGAVAGVALSIILSPTELVKCRMQVGQHTSPLTCLQHLVQTEGLWGLSRGFRATLCREVPGNALFFTVYEGLRRSWLGGRPTGHGSSSSSSGNGGGDGGSGGSSSAGSSPLAVAWAIAQDAGGAILCGGLAGVAVSTRPPCQWVNSVAAAEGAHQHLYADRWLSGCCHQSVYTACKLVLAGNLLSSSLTICRHHWATTRIDTICVNHS